MDMSFARGLKLFVPTSLFFLMLDFIWLNVLAKDFYLRTMGHLLDVRDGQIQFNFAGAIGVYLVLIIGLFLFALPRANTLWEAGLWGALFGLVTYGTYDFTNHAVMRDWQAIINVVDIAWGMLLCGLTALFTYQLGQWIR